MNRQESYQILALLQANYPDAFRGMSDEAAKMKINLWAEMFADEPFEIVSAAAKAFMATDTKGFAPAVGQIKERIANMRQSDVMTGQDAWNIVTKALRNSAYGSAEEFAQLPPEIQRAVGSPSQLRDWAMMDPETVQSVVASNFQRSFRVRQERERDFAKLPSEVQAFIGQIANTCVGRLELEGKHAGTS